MRNKIANFLSFFKKLNKRTLGVLFVFISLGLFTPLYSSQAIIGLGLAEQIASAIFSLMFGKFVLMSGGILAISAGILNWITTGGFTTFAYTHNPFVTPMWEMMRDLANMLFVIILIMIGLATSLRLREYEVKKILPLFIIFALLINFTPVITGLVVDASNIVMNTFLQATAEFTNYAFIFGADLLLDLTGNPVDHLVEIIVVIIFNLITSVIFLLFALLFAFRYIAIWTLVILSPLAFACYILPATRKIFTQWWNVFLQWCFIGVTAALFLYLGQQALSVISDPSYNQIPVDIPGGTPIISNIINKILPYGISLTLFILGFLASFSIGAMGASQVISGAKKGGKWTGRQALVLGVKGQRKISGKIRESEKIEKVTEHIREKVEPVLKKYPRVKAGVGWVKRRKEDVEKIIPPIKVPGVPTPVEEELEFVKLKGKYIKEAKEVAKRKPETLISVVRRGAITKEQKAKRAAYKEALLSVIPSRAPEIGENIEKTVKKMSPDDFRKNIHPDALKNLDVFRAMSTKQLEEIGEKGTIKQKEAINDTMISNLGKITKEIKRLKDEGKTKEAAELARKKLMAKSPNFRY